MIEDKLTQTQRLRLECLNQAVASTINQTHNKTADALVERATTFEEYLSSETDE